MIITEGSGLKHWQQDGLGCRVGGLWPVQGVTAGLPSHPNNYTLGSVQSWVGSCSVPSRGQTLSGVPENKRGHAGPGCLGSSSATAGLAVCGGYASFTRLWAVDKDGLRPQKEGGYSESPPF